MAPEAHTPRAFVAGATGYVGRAVVERLRDAGIPVTAHVRPDSASLGEWTERFAAMGAIVDTTEWSRVPITAAIARTEPTHVFALIGTSRRRARRSSDAAERASPYESVDYGLTSMLLKSCVSVGMRPRFIYLSSIGADSRARNSYLRVRGRLERELRDSGLPYVVFRPSFITGRDRPEYRLAERAGAVLTDAAARVLNFARLGRFLARLRSIDAVTLADAMVGMSLEADAANRVIERDELPPRGSAGKRPAMSALPRTGPDRRRHRGGGS